MPNRIPSANRFRVPSRTMRMDIAPILNQDDEPEESRLTRRMSRAPQRHDGPRRLVRRPIRGLASTWSADGKRLPDHVNAVLLVFIAHVFQDV